MQQPTQHLLLPTDKISFLMQDEIFKDYAGMGVLFNTVMVIEAASQRWHEELSSAEPSCTPAARSDAPAAAPNEASPKAAVLPSCPTIVTVDPIVERKSTVRIAAGFFSLGAPFHPPHLCSFWDMPLRCTPWRKFSKSWLACWKTTI